MDKALRLVAKLKNKIVTDEELARAAWKAAVGDRLEIRARFRGLVRDRIVIEVDDALWQRQMTAMEGQILGKLSRIAGKAIANQIEYRIAIPKPGPEMETEAEFRLQMANPEARGIKDSGLRRVYLQSKRKAAGQ